VSRRRAVIDLAVAVVVIVAVSGVLVALTAADPVGHPRWWTLSWWIILGLAWSCWTVVLTTVALGVRSAREQTRPATSLLGGVATRLALSMSLLGLLPSLTGTASAAVPLRPNGAVTLAHRAPPPAATTHPTLPRIYRVRPGDCLWTIAATELGSPLKWRTLASLNLGRTMANGVTFTNPSLIDVGWQLLLPAVTPPSNPARSATPPPVHHRPPSEETPPPSTSHHHGNRTVHASTEDLIQMVGIGVVALAASVGALRRRRRGARVDLGAAEAAFVGSEACAAGAHEALLSALNETPGSVPMVAHEGAPVPIETPLWVLPPGTVVRLNGPDARALVDLQLLVVDAITSRRPTVACSSADEAIRALDEGAAVLFLSDPSVLPSTIQHRVVSCVVDASISEPEDPTIAPATALLAELLDAEPSPPAAPAEEVRPVEPWIRLLTPEPRIVGLTTSLEPRRERRAVEVAAYLALHRGEAITGDRLRSAVFATANGDGSAKNLANTLSALRQSLGISADGSPRLPLATRAGRYSLSGAVRCDLFEAMTHLDVATATEDPVLVLASVRAACELIDGPPASAVRLGWEWLAAEGTLLTFADDLTVAVERAVAIGLDLGHLDLCALLVERASMVTGCSERLLRVDLSVIAARGDVTALARRWQHHLAALDALEGGLHPAHDTEDHYWALQRTLLAST